MRHEPRTARWAAIGLMVVILLPAGTAGAATTVPCAPGASVVPTFQTGDAFGRGSKRLTATHVIAVTAAFPEAGAFSADTSSVKWSAPAGVPVVTYRQRGADGVDVDGPEQYGVAPNAGGPLPVTAVWEQSDGTSASACIGSATTTLQIAAAKALHPSIPRGSAPRDASKASEYSWYTTLRGDSDLRPLQIRLRSSRGARLPKHSLRFNTTTVALRTTDPGFGATHRVSSRFVTVYASDESGEFVNLLVQMRAVISNPKLGYELQIVQGGRVVGSIRAAGQCSAFGCDFTTFAVKR